MPLITYVLTFNEPINVSVQVGDMVYYTTNVITSGTLDPDLMGSGSIDPMSSDVLGNVIQFGKIQQITNQYGEFITDANGVIIPITIQVTALTPPINPPTPSDFIMFGKDKTVNTSSLIGYYAQVNFVNNSTEKVELFSVGSEIFESSK